MYLAALHKIPTQIEDSSKVLAKYIRVLAKCIRQRQPQMTKKVTRKWD